MDHSILPKYDAPEVRVAKPSSGAAKLRLLRVVGRDSNGEQHAVHLRIERVHKSECLPIDSARLTPEHASRWPGDAGLATAQARNGTMRALARQRLCGRHGVFVPVHGGDRRGRVLHLASGHRQPKLRRRCDWPVFTSITTTVRLTAPCVWRIASSAGRTTACRAERALVGEGSGGEGRWSEQWARAGDQSREARLPEQESEAAVEVQL